MSNSPLDILLDSMLFAQYIRTDAHVNQPFEAWKDKNYNDKKDDGESHE